MALQGLAGWVRVGVQGRLVERGSHRSLVRAGGIYANLVARQTSGGLSGASDTVRHARPCRITEALHVQPIARSPASFYGQAPLLLAPKSRTSVFATSGHGKYLFILAFRSVLAERQSSEYSVDHSDRAPPPQLSNQSSVLCWQQCSPAKYSRTAHGLSTRPSAIRVTA